MPEADVGNLPTEVDVVFGSSSRCRTNARLVPNEVALELFMVFDWGASGRSGEVLGEGI